MAASPLRAAGRLLAQASAGRHLLRMEAAATRADVHVLPTWATPTTISDGYTTQKEMSDALVEMGFRMGGWKLGATNADGQKRLNLTEPFFGFLKQDDLIRLSSPKSTYIVRQAPRIRGVELEYVTQMGCDITYPELESQKSKVWEAVEWVYPAIEVCASRLHATPAPPPPLAIADQASHGSLIIGPRGQGVSGREWGEGWMTREALTSRPAILKINGKEVVRGNGTDVLENPMLALEWLLKALWEQRSTGLKKGDVVTTGTMTGLTPVQAGDVVQGEFTGMGSLQVEFLQG